MLVRETLLLKFIKNLFMLKALKSLSLCILLEFESCRKMVFSQYCTSVSIFTVLMLKMCQKSRFNLFEMKQIEVICVYYVSNRPLLMRT